MGSSPLTRGKRGHGRRSFTARRLIPAHAGKTMQCYAHAYKSAAHPRSRGENPALGLLALAVCGSSPLTRGKHQEPNFERLSIGLIPAHAGKTGAYSVAWSSGWAHPRSRGENARVPTGAVTCSGSSPLTRGKRDETLDEAPASGLIPAHAGKTATSSRDGRIAGAHPRSRGENDFVSERRRPSRGSSPLTRGKRGVAG